MKITQLLSQICRLTARALSIISAMLLLFKYLELAPKRFASSIYLTGTTLGRAGRDLQVVLLLFLVVIVAFSIVGSEMFGAELDEFKSVPSAFFSLCICVECAVQEALACRRALERRSALAIEKVA